MGAHGGWVHSQMVCCVNSPSGQWYGQSGQSSREKLLEPLTMRELEPYVMGWGHSFHHEFLFLIMENLEMFKCLYTGSRDKTADNSEETLSPLEWESEARGRFVCLLTRRSISLSFFLGRNERHGGGWKSKAIIGDLQ